MLSQQLRRLLAVLTILLTSGAIRPNFSFSVRLQPLTDSDLESHLQQCLRSLDLKELHDGIGSSQLREKLHHLHLLAQSKPSHQSPQERQSLDTWAAKRHRDFFLPISSTKKRGFDSWGGKRNLHREQVQLVNTDDKRTGSFNSWGGKRNSKKRGLDSWGGKRNLHREQVQLVNTDDKRTGSFNSWGGKRNLEGLLGGRERVDNKRNFNAWGGKRSHDDLSVQIPNSEGKRKFNSWGGDRSLEDDLSVQIPHSEEKRNFNSWGGKRSLEDDLSVQIPNSWEKRNFNSWGGKRSQEDESVLQLRSSEEKRGFNSWGGKRSETFGPWVAKRSQEDSEEQDDNSGQGFHPWGGKRSAGLLFRSPAQFQRRRRALKHGNSRSGRPISIRDVLEHHKPQEDSQYDNLPEPLSLLGEAELVSSGETSELLGTGPRGEETPPSQGSSDWRILPQECRQFLQQASQSMQSKLKV